MEQRPVKFIGADPQVTFGRAVSKQFQVKVLQQVKDEDGKIVNIDPETFPPDLLQAIVGEEAIQNPDRLMQAHMQRAAALNQYQTRMTQRLSPVLTQEYLSRMEATPIEQTRSKFVEQPFKLRNDVVFNLDNRNETNRKLQE